MQQVTFTAGYGDPNRTIQQKYSDYDKIDELMSKLRQENAVLEEKLHELEARRTSLIQSFNNVEGMDRKDIQRKIRNLDKKISEIKDKIEENRDTGRKAWYGFHERY